MSDQKKDDGCYLHLVCLVNNIKYTKLMHVADIFEKGKVVFAEQLYELSISKHLKLNDKKIRKLLDTMVTFQDKDMSFILIHIDHIENIKKGKVTLEYNKGKIIPAYDKEVRIISDGKGWNLLHKYVSHLGFNPVLTENVYITEIQTK